MAKIFYELRQNKNVKSKIEVPQLSGGDAAGE